MDKRDLQLEIAQLIGQPINTQLPVPVELALIADTGTAEAGEHVWKYEALDDTPDVILAVDGAGRITVKEVSPLGDVEITFSGLNSKMEYVLIDAVLSSPDTDILSRRRESITRGMDKTEIKTILDAIVAPLSAGDPRFPAELCEEITLETTEDLYDLIVKMKHAVEDYGDGYVLLCGSAVKEAIDNYDKAINAGNVGGISLPAKLKELGINVVKVFGKVSNDESAESEVALLDTNKMILVAMNSRLAQGKPISFIRRKIAPAVAQLMGANVDTAQRALVVGGTPVLVEGANTLAYSVYGYESVVFAITNPKAIKFADASDVV